MKSSGSIRVIINAAALSFALFGGPSSASTSNASWNPLPVFSPFYAHVVLYTALGASDAVGVGSSRPCATSGNPPIPHPVDCPRGTGYVPDIRTSLSNNTTAVRLTDVGVSGAVIGPDIQEMAMDYGRDTTGNLIQQELPYVTSGLNIITIFAGANDTLAIAQAVNLGAGFLNPQAFIDQEVTQFGNDYVNLIAGSGGIRSRSPNAKIVVANVPNLGALPFAAGFPRVERRLLQNISVEIDKKVINSLVSLHVAVVDALCDPRTYTASNFSGDGYHPNDAGYDLLAANILNAIRLPSYPLPKASCPQMNLF